MLPTRRIIPLIGAAALVAGSAIPAAAAEADAEHTDLQTRVEDFVGLVPGGVAVATIRDGVVELGAAGIADSTGDPLTVDTPFTLGRIGSPVVSTLALVLVDSGILDMDALVVDYVPDAPVDPAATVRQLLEFSAGAPRVFEALTETILEDSDRSWSAGELVDLADPEQVGRAGEYAPNMTQTLITRQVIEAATGQSYGDALAEYLGEPLGLTNTAHPLAAEDVPEGMAGGWSPDLGMAGDQAWESVRSSRPTTSTAADLAQVVGALVGGELIAEDLAATTVFDESLPGFAYSLERPGGPMISDLGPLGARYFTSFGAWINGVNGMVAGSPDTGDVIVVLSNADDLSSPSLVRDILTDWAPDLAESTTVQTFDATGTIRSIYNSMCQLDPSSTLGLPPCDVDQDGLHIPMSSPFEITGSFDGFGTFVGDVVVAEDGSFSVAGSMVTAGTVEGCGPGTLHFTYQADGRTDQDTALNDYESQFAETVSTLEDLPVTGRLDFAGLERDLGDGTFELDYTGTYSCEPMTVE